MFLVADMQNCNFRHHTNDINTAADIILGITGDERDYKRSINIMGNMLHGDVFANDKYGIRCDPGDEPNLNRE